MIESRQWAAGKWGSVQRHRGGQRKSGSSGKHASVDDEMRMGEWCVMERCTSA